jgi:hypothetical protein
MTYDLYIGIENELISFRNNKPVPFNITCLNKIPRNKKIQEKEDCGLWSNNGNLLYLDGNEIEIATTPIPINSGFATRLTDLLVIERNQIIKNTPHLKHTGYSMHWNLSESYYSHINEKAFYNDIAIPFQLFGLTPMSCGFKIQSKSNCERLEIAGDSLTNVNQIKATALLLGAYTIAKNHNHNFPIRIKEITYSNTTVGNFTKHSVPKGRYTIFNVSENLSGYKNNFKETQAQNILELFYDWISPLVYKLGERDEINNLEAFITGEQKLEMDDVKYFYMLDKKNKEYLKKYSDISISPILNKGIYGPIFIQTNNSKRSQIIKLTANNRNVNIPLEGMLWKKFYDVLSKNKEYMCRANWNSLLIRDKKSDVLNNNIAGITNIYSKLAELTNMTYTSDLDCSEVQPKIITDETYQKVMNKKSIYNSNKDNSAIIENTIECFLDFRKHIKK